MDVKVDDLLVFSKVAELKNFSKTADQLGMVKSMVSKRITRLEKSLGVRLIYRSTRSMSLTDEGQTLYEYTSRMQEELDGAVQAIALTRKEPSGLLRVQAPLSFGAYYLPRMIADFMLEHPSIQVELELSSYMGDLIQSGVDVGLHVGQPADSNLLARKVGTSQLTVCAAPQYFRAHGTPLAIEDLSQHNCLIHHHLPQSGIWTFQEKQKSKHIRVQGSFTSNSSQSLKHAAIAGVGIVMLPDYSLRSEINEGKLVELFADKGKQAVNIYALFPYTKHVAPKLRVFLDFSVKYMQRVPNSQPVET